MYDIDDFHINEYELKQLQDKLNEFHDLVLNGYFEFIIELNKLPS